jgi:DNA-binding NtrC family response regulator
LPEALARMPSDLTSSLAIVITARHPREIAGLAGLRRAGLEPLVVADPGRALRLVQGRALSLVALERDPADVDADTLVRSAREATRLTRSAVIGRPDDPGLHLIGHTYVVGRKSDIDNLRRALEARDAARRADLGDYEALFGREGAVGGVDALVRTAAGIDAPVLIEGEPGSGQDLVASAIHVHSARADGPFVRVNCRSAPPESIERELAGGRSRQAGRLELAAGGTRFFDEIGELPLALQRKIFKTLGRRQSGRSGSDVRLIAASSHAGGVGPVLSTFLDELGVMRIAVPALRERRDEIPLLGEHFRAKFARELQRTADVLSADIIDLMTTYGWPGNVRELESLIKRYVAFGDHAMLREELGQRLAQVSAMRTRGTKRSRGAPPS